MSTKAIRKVLRDMACDETPCRVDACRKHEALAEVEAIEKAAKVLSTCAIGLPDDGMTVEQAQRAHGLMKIIAKETSK